jgi:hypothetical protein
MAYEDQTVAQLRELLKSRSQPVYGSKTDLIDRLTKADAGPEPPAAQAPVGHRAGFAWTVTVADDTYLSDEAWHAANKQACLREADARSLLPVGGVDTVHVDTEHLPDGRVRLTYTASVARSS